MNLPPRYRYELKYRLSLEAWNRIKYDLLQFLPLDTHAQIEDGYLVTSLYFDNLDLMLYQEKVEGFEQREKLRIRCYNHQSDVISFEIKGRDNQAVYKQRVSLTKAEFDAIIKEDYDFLLSKGIIGEKLYWKLRADYVRPQVVVEYQRLAFTLPMVDIRISADTMVRGHESTDIFHESPAVDLLGRDIVVLEIKGSEKIPRYLKDILKRANVMQVENSKYALAIEKVKEGEWTL